MVYNGFMKHLAIFKGKGAEKILAGQKTIESRFSSRRIAPFGVVGSGDLVYIKPSGGQIIGQFKVKKVIFYDNLDLSDLSYLKKKYGSQLAVDEGYWVGKDKCKFGTLIFIGNSAAFITSPIRLKKKDLRGWMVLD